jgi:hypothetical protein
MAPKVDSITIGQKNAMFHEKFLIAFWLCSVIQKPLPTLSWKNSMLSRSTSLKFFLTFHRKDKDVGRVFARGFSWPAAIDAAADVYNGVSIAT